MMRLRLRLQEYARGLCLIVARDASCAVWARMRCDGVLFHNAPGCGRSATVRSSVSLAQIAAEEGLIA